MKKYTLLAFGLIASFVLISWGYEGHHAIAAIGENHLTPKAEQAVKSLLLGATMADVSTYADDIKNQPDYKTTSTFHYLDIPAGYNYEQFSAAIKNSSDQNIYSGLVACINDLRSPAKTSAQKTFALKMLIHLVGDCHQPMHVGRTEDRGGNKTMVRFLGIGTDLHGLWDDGLLTHQKLKYKDIAVKYDDATPEQIKKWQSDSIMVWLWESYQISTILYQEAADNPNFDEKYYQDHLPILKNRIEKAGIRLAGVLNEIYK